MSSFAPVRGRVHSVQSMGTVDGPGVRFVVFFQGCPLRCGCCHNPDTWSFEGGQEMTAQEIVKKAERCRPYFGKQGGITLSGGEPLMQVAFAHAIFSLCRECGIHTCLDTSGVGDSEQISALLDVTDRVLLDVKYPTDALYLSHVGCGIEAPLTFLDRLQEKKIPTTLRQVVIPSLTDTKESMEFLAHLKQTHSCVDHIELLPFRKICSMKYEQMGLEFPFALLPTPMPSSVDALRNYLDTLLSETES